MKTLGFQTTSKSVPREAKSGGEKGEDVFIKVKNDLRPFAMMYVMRWSEKKFKISTSLPLLRIHSGGSKHGNSSIHIHKIFKIIM